VWIRWRGPFGLAQKTLRTPVGATIQALPDMRGLRSAAIRFDAREALSGVKPQHQIGEGSEFESLRDYAPGLDPRQIDWKRSAKHRKLLSKELTIERNHHIVLAFDTGHLTGEPIDGVTRLDRAIAAGLALAWVSLRAGDLVGAFAFDSSARFFLQPGRGMSWFERLRRGVGELGYGVAETNFTLALAELNVRLKRRTLIVLFTEFVDTTTAELMLESLKLTSARHAVVFVTLRDPELAALVEATPENFVKAAQSVVAHDFQRERAIVMERLHRLGVHCLDAPPQNVSTRLIDRYLSIKEKGQL
jgi:uncharacterized protein (DUF58 family)